MFVNQIPVPHSQGKLSPQSVVQSSNCCLAKNGWKFQHHPNLWMKECSIGWKTRDKERKEKSQSSFLNFQAISEPCEATVLRGSVEKERDVRERWHADNHRHRNYRGAPTCYGDGELGWALTLSGLQKLPYSFLTSNLLTYLPTKSLHRHLGAMAVPRSSPHLHRHRPHLRAFAQGIWLLLCGLVTTKKYQAKQRERTSLASKALTELSDGRKSATQIVLGLPAVVG